MSKSKLEKFDEIEILQNVFQNFDYKNPKLFNQKKEVQMKGNWRSQYFKNNNPIVLELACGRGEYTVALAARFPDNNFIGVDVKGNRIWTGATQSVEQNLSNTAFVRTYIQLMHHFFEPNEIDEIWITFPDPFPRKSDRMNRLTSPRFIDYYKQVLKPNTLIHFKTDNLPLFRYTLGVLDGLGIEPEGYVEDIYNVDKKPDDILKIPTYYETLHKAKGAIISYLSFRI